MSGVVVYDGPSLINGEPIVCILTLGKSKNVKTGDMIQTWILVNNKKSPLDNARLGNDESICGNCIHRPQNDKLGSCYVNLAWAPGRIYETFLDGKYEDYDPKVHNKYIKGRILRLGAYGEPTAIPYRINSGLVKLCPYHTGYTHNWHKCDKRFKKILMASVDTPNQVSEANSLGWRTFRVRVKDNDPILNSEISCPASAEMNNIRTCATCKACHGAGSNPGKAKNIAILAHGWPYKLKKYEENRSKLIALEMV